MAVTTTKTNKPLNPRGNDQSPKGYNRAELFSGKALDFDGVNDYVEVPYNADTRPTNEITLSAIVKLDDWNLSVFERVISCTEAGGWHIANGEGSYIPTQNTGMLIRLSSSGYVAVYVSNDILKDEYNHLTTTFDGRYLKMYVNGVLAATTDSGTTQTITYAVNNSIYIGAEAGGGSGTPSGNYIDGQISNTKIFNTALTAAQVADLYNNPEKVVPTGVADSALKLWLPMQEGAGTTAYDGAPLSELLSNGEFNNATNNLPDDFTLTGTQNATNSISVSDGKLTLISDGTYIGITQSNVVSIGTSYSVSIDVDSLPDNALTIALGSGTDEVIYGAGVYTFNITATDTSFELKRAFGTGSVVGVVNSVSVKPIQRNHGTISGATYTHGIGAPVSQTAVIDWNKGQNNLTYSEDFSQYGTGGDAVVTSGFSAPDGSNNAYKISSASINGSIFRSGESGANYYRSIYARTTSGTGTIDLLSYFGNTNNTFTITEEWQRFEVSTTDSSLGVNNFYAVDFRNPSATLNEVIIWGGHTKADSSSGPYTPTIGTAQTSDVLLPQGLTTGRDITGVNLFENVRKQGALNLDGNSWAEVHDNASLDITDAVSVEMWIYWEDQSAESTILGKWLSGDNRAYALIATTTTGEIDFRQRVSSSTYSLGIYTLSSGWNHVVATHDHSANERIGYINGVQVSTSSSQGVSNESDNDVTIGGSATAQYTNSIAQPRIYNRALTAEEVARNYNNAKSIYTNS